MKEWPFASRRNDNKSHDRRKSSHRRKSFLIINPILLSKTPGNNASLVAINSAIRSSLDLINPFTIDSRFSRGEINQISCSSLMQCIQLFFHEKSEVPGERQGQKNNESHEGEKEE